jgi:hypothetical protein
MLLYARWENDDNQPEGTQKIFPVLIGNTMIQKKHDYFGFDGHKV